MFCNKCGTENPGDSLFCKKYGYKIGSEEPIETVLVEQPKDKLTELSKALQDRYEIIREIGRGGMAILTGGVAQNIGIQTALEKKLKN